MGSAKKFNHYTLYILYKIYPEKKLYFAENSLYKQPLFFRETARGPEPCHRHMKDFLDTNDMPIVTIWDSILPQFTVVVHQQCQKINRPI